MDLGQLDAGLNALDVVRITRESTGAPSALVVDGVPLEIGSGGPAGPPEPSALIKVYKVAPNQDAPAQWTTVMFGAASVQDGIAFDTVTSRATPSVAGWYWCFGQWTALGNAGRALNLRKNGVQIGVMDGVALILQVGVMAYFDGVADYLDMAMWGAPGQVAVAGENSTWLSMVKV